MDCRCTDTSDLRHFGPKTFRHHYYFIWREIGLRKFYNISLTVLRQEDAPPTHSTVRQIARETRIHSPGSTPVRQQHLCWRSFACLYMHIMSTNKRRPRVWLKSPPPPSTVISVYRLGGWWSRVPPNAYPVVQTPFTASWDGQIAYI